MSLRKIVVLGPSQGRRLLALEQAAMRGGIAEVQAVGYADFLRDPGRVGRVLAPGTWLRFESPDEDPAAFEALYHAGAPRAEALGFKVISGPDLALTCSGSAIGSPAQLVFGMTVLLRKAAHIASEAGAYVSADPDYVTLCYNKRACAAHLSTIGVPTAPELAVPNDADEILDQVGVGRMFLKLNYGSGAAGTIAVAFGAKGRIAAYTALETDNGTLHATKRVRRLTERAEVRKLVQALIPLGLHAETWVPKAGVDGMTADLRMVVTQKAAPFTVLRMSRTPITNLHLDAERAPAERLFAKMPSSAVGAIHATARKVMRGLDNRMGMLGLDVAVTPDLKDHVVLEANAFGDHIRNVVIDGMTPLDRQVHEAQERMEHVH